MKKIKANCYTESKYYVFETSTLKDYEVRLTLTKINLNYV